MCVFCHGTVKCCHVVMFRTGQTLFRFTYIYWHACFSVHVFFLARLMNDSPE